MSESQTASGKHPHVDLGFAGEFVALKEQLAVSFDTLADRSGLSRSYLQDIAHGRRGQTWPSESIVERIAGALNVNPDHFTITKARVVLEEPDVLAVAYVKAKSVRKLRAKREARKTAA